MVAINTSSASPVATGRADRAAASRQEALHDVALVRRFNTGEDDAFVEIIARYQAKMFSVAYAQLHNYADAEEVTQDTFIRAHRALAQFRGDSSLSTWLHRITVNLARNRYWHFFRRCRHLTQSLDRPLTEHGAETFAELVACEAPGPARESTIREFSALVAECMEDLTSPQREILTLRNTLNNSYDEIATTLGINVGTVKSRIARARGNLRALIVKACPEFSSDDPPVEWFDPIRPLNRARVGRA